MADVLLQDGIVHTIGQAIEVGPGVRVVDATGLYVLPGGVDTGFWKDAVSRHMPTEDFLTAEQVADTVVALARMDASVVPQELVLRALKDRDFAHV